MVPPGQLWQLQLKDFPQLFSPGILIGNISNLNLNWMSILGTIWKAMQIIYIFYFFRSIHYSRCFYLLPVVLLTLVWNIPRFMELETCYKLNISRVSLCDVNNTSECQLTVCVTEIRRNLSYCRDYILIGNFLIMIFLPLLLLSFLNGHIYHVLEKHQH